MAGLCLAGDAVIDKVDDNSLGATGRTVAMQCLVEVVVIDEVGYSLMEASMDGLIETQTILLHLTGTIYCIAQRIEGLKFSIPCSIVCRRWFV